MKQKAMFGGGCFWCIEDEFRKVKGVSEVFSGYSGGKTKNPTYQEVCSDTTGHAEVVEITFDDAQVSYKELLKVFFEIHDPTQLNAQGPDEGSQYRSVIFYHSPEQLNDANQTILKLSQSPRFKNQTIVTEIKPASIFYKAEEYHQCYYKKLRQEN